MERKRLVKTGLFVLAGFFAVYCAGFAFINFRYSKPNLKNQVSLYLKNNFDRSVIIKDISVTPFFNLILTDVQISGNSDFNDTGSMITCDEIEIHPSLFYFVAGKIKINSVEIFEPSVSVAKPYGKSYSDTAKTFFSGILGDKIWTAVSSIKSLKVYKGTARYSETMKKDSSVVIFSDISLSVLKTASGLNLSFISEVSDSRNAQTSGDLEINSHLLSGQDGAYEFSETKINAENIQLSFFNGYQIIGDTAFFEKGTVSFDMDISGFAGMKTISSSLDIAGMTIDDLSKTSGGVLCSDENIRLVFDGSLSDFEKQMKFEIESESGFKSNGRFKLSAGEIIDFYVDIDECNLSEIFKHYHLKNGGKFSGDVSVGLSGCGKMSSPLPSFSLLNGVVSVKNLSVSGLSEGKSQKYMDSLSLTATFNEVSALLSGSAVSGKTDVSAELSFDINSWQPFSSESFVDVKSENLEFQRFLAAYSYVFNEIYSISSDDRMIGYNELYFRNRSFGQFVLNNNITMPISVSSLSFSSKAAIRDIHLLAVLRNGNFSSNLLSASGYGASYGFSVQSYMNADYPVIKCSYSVDNFDAGAFYSDSSFPGVISSGRLSVSGSVDTSAYRASHLIENTRSSFGINFTAENIQNTPFQTRLDSVVKKSGENSSFSLLNQVRFSYKTETSSDKKYLREFLFSSDLLSASDWGQVDSSGFSNPLSVDYFDSIGKRQNMKLPVVRGVSLYDFPVKISSGGKEEIINLM